MSIASKLAAWVNSADGKARMQDKVMEYVKSGKDKTAAGDSVINEARMNEAAAKFIQILQSTAGSYNLPASVMAHIDSMSMRDIKWMNDTDSFEIPLYFGGDLHRESLENGYSSHGGIRNIVAMFNNGYKNNPIPYTYGWWDGHSPTGASLGRSTSGDNSFAWVRSRNNREALRFIQQAISDFNGNYGSEYNVTAIIPNDDYEEI